MEDVGAEDVAGAGVVEAEDTADELGVVDVDGVGVVENDGDVEAAVDGAADDVADDTESDTVEAPFSEPSCITC